MSFAARALAILAFAWLSIQTVCAQQATFLNAPSPEKIAVTSGGVDIRTGRFAYSKTDLSIGDGAGAIKLERTMLTAISGNGRPFGNMSHNWDISLVIKQAPLSQYPGHYDYVANINYGGRSQTFEKLYPQDAGAFRQKSQNDSTKLTTTGPEATPGSVYTYQATDGTVVVFRPLAEAACTQNGNACAFASYIVEPDGTRFDLEYEMATSSGANQLRLRSVTSSRGYALLFEYGLGGAGWFQVSKACVLNLATIAKSSSNVCPSNAPATTTYTYSTVDGRVSMASAIAPDSAAENMTYFSVQAGVSFSMGFTKPGQTTPWLTNSNSFYFTQDGDKEPVVTSQAFVDGQGFTYGYDLTPATVDGNGASTSYESISGGYYTNALGQMTEVRYDFPATPASFNPPRVFINGIGQPPAPVKYGDIVYQVTTGPARIIDALGRITSSDYCDAYAMANLPSSEHNRCLVTRLQSSTDPEGNQVKVKYGINNNPTEIRHVAKSGSGLADLVETAYYDGSTCTTTLTICNKPVSVTDAKGVTTDYTWDSTHGGMLTETKAAPSSGATRPQKRYSYAQFYAWYKNAAGTMVQSPYPTWLVTQISECATGSAPACVGTADETRTTFTYGASGTANNLLPVSKTIALGDGSQTRTTSWTYDDFGNKLTEDGPQAGTADTTRWRYDVLRRVIGVVGPDPDGAGGNSNLATRNTYDVAGRLVKVEKGRVNSQSDADWAGFVTDQSTETTYDALDHKLTETVKGSNGAAVSLTQFSYDLAGRPDCTAVRMNPAVYASLPTSACTLGTQGSAGPDRITKNVYDAAGQLVQVRKAVGTPLEQAYVTYSYTQNGKQEFVIDANGNRAKLEYDGFERQVKWIFPSQTLPSGFNPATQATALSTAGSLNTADYEQYGYDANGNRTGLRKRDGVTQPNSNWTITYAYDALNRLTTKTVADAPSGGLAATHSRDVYYGYDLRGLQTSARFDSTNGEGITSTYDGFGNNLTSTLAMDGVSRTITSYYDADNNRTQVFHPDGIGFRYWYDGLDRANAVAFRKPGDVYDGSALVQTIFNADGSRWQDIRQGGSHVYGWDPVGRLSQWQLIQSPAGAPNSETSRWNFTYNPASQITSIARTNDAFAWTGRVNVNRGYTPNGLNQYGAVGGAAYCYDTNGNLTYDGISVYRYDMENRLVEKRTAQGSTCPTATTGYGGTLLASLRYDPAGRLYETVGQTTGTTRFLYDGDNLVAEFDAAGNLLRRYAHGANASADDPLFWFEGATTSWTAQRQLISDQQGSIVAVSLNDGTNLAINSYDEYGIPNCPLTSGLPDCSAVGANKGRFQYTGQAWIPELGMYYYKARIYSPILGRFMQTDPIGYKDQVNLYAYVANDPVDKTDFSGLEAGSCYGSSGWSCGMGASDNRSFGEKLGDAIFAVSVILDIADTEVSPGPDISLAGKAAQTALRGEGAAARAEIKASQPYVRPSNATTPAQRASVQGKPCVKCGETTPVQRAGHKEPLVKEHYEKGSIDKDRMRSKDAVQPECPTCSNREGAEMSRYSREMRRRLDDK